MGLGVPIEVEPALSTAGSEQIVRALVGYNDAQASPEIHCSLAVVARKEGQIVGGLLGSTHWGWLFVKQLWAAQELRSDGVGRQLVLVAETEVLARGCRHAHLDTFSFQALGFHQRLGHGVFGQLDDDPTGHTRYFLHKRNLHVSESA